MGVDEKIGNPLAVPSGVAGTEVIREKLLIGFSLVELASFVMLDVVFAWDTIVTRLGCRFPCLNQAVCGSGRPRVGCEAVGSRFEAAKRKQRRPSFELRSRACPISAVTSILFRYPEIDTRRTSGNGDVMFLASTIT